MDRPKSRDDSASTPVSGKKPRGKRAERESKPRVKGSRNPFGGSIVSAETDHPASEIVLERDIRLDSKKRATLTGAQFEHYHMSMQRDGSILLEPRILGLPAPVTPRVLEMIDGSIENLQRAQTGEAVDFARYRALLDEDDE